MRKRLRSTMKWSGTMLTVLLLVVWVGSRSWYASASVAERGCVYVCWGCLSISWERPWADPRGPLEIDLMREMPHFIWWFRYREQATPALSVRRMDIPVWIIAMLVAVPSAWLWYRDRRRAPGLCIKCGYDLRGNASGVCPECGSA